MRTSKTHYVRAGIEFITQDRLSMGLLSVSHSSSVGIPISDLCSGLNVFVSVRMSINCVLKPVQNLKHADTHAIPRASKSNKGPDSCYGLGIPDSQTVDVQIACILNT